MHVGRTSAAIVESWLIWFECGGGRMPSSPSILTPRSGRSASTPRKPGPDCATTGRNASRCPGTWQRDSRTTRSTRFCCTRWRTRSPASARATGQNGRSSLGTSATWGRELTTAPWLTSSLRGLGDARGVTNCIDTDVQPGRCRARSALGASTRRTRLPGRIARSRPRCADAPLRLCRLFRLRRLGQPAISAVTR